MKSYIRILSAVFVLVFAFCAVGMCSVSAEGDYTQPEKFIYGDVNQDLEVNVKDVTYIQKGLANLIYVTAVQRFLADPEGEGYSIKNATAIQKYLAKYEVSSLLGTELPMTSQDEFSKKFSIEDDFNIQHIVIGVKQTNEYTIEDFTEYNFKAIETYAEFDNINITAYYLLLETPSKENVVEAIKALDYRANIDILWAEPDYIIYAVDDE